MYCGKHTLSFTHTHTHTHTQVNLSVSIMYCGKHTLSSLSLSITHTGEFEGINHVLWEAAGENDVALLQQAISDGAIVNAGMYICILCIYMMCICMYMYIYIYMCVCVCVGVGVSVCINYVVL